VIKVEITMQSLVEKNRGKLDDIVVIKFYTEQDRRRGVAALMRYSELFKSVDRYQFKIRRKELGLFKDKHIRYSIRRS
jgi:hypothetical protein